MIKVESHRTGSVTHYGEEIKAMMKNDNVISRDALREMTLADERFYWTRTGENATVLEQVCVLSETVKPEALKKAVKSALGVHINFRQQPVIDGHSLKILVQEPDLIPVFPASDAPMHLGTAGTGGMVVYVTYEGCEIVLHVFHGVADARGIYDFLRTLIIYYLYEAGLADCTGTLPKSSDTAPAFEGILSRSAPEDPIGRVDIGRLNTFHIPEKRTEEGMRFQHRYEIDVPLEPLLSLSRASESTVLPTLEAIFGKAIRTVYDVGEKDIVAYTPYDLRGFFGFETSGNGCSSVSMIYRPKMDRYDLGERASFLRAMLDLQTQPGNGYASVEGFRKTVQGFREASGSVEEIAAAGQTKVSSAEGKAYTYGFSYPGKFRLPKEAEPFVKSISLSTKNHSYPLWILACEYNGTIRIILVQTFDSDTLARAIYQELQDIIPETAFEDKGRHCFDEFHFCEVPHIS